MIRLILLALTLLIGSVPVIPARAALAPVETRMVAIVAAEEARTLGVLETLVNQNSGTLNLAGVEAVGRMLRAELEPIGFAVRWVPMRQAGRAGHLVATRTGKAGTKRLLLIGHLDTVFEPDSPFQKFERKGDRIVGPGVNDMKGGDMVMVAALRAMDQAGVLKDANIEIVLTGDEESVGKPQDFARADLIAAGRRADLALEFESLATVDGKDVGSIARRGSITWHVSVKAKPGHSSGVFSDSAGYGTSYELGRIIDSFRRELREPSLTYNVALVMSGTAVARDVEGVSGTASGKANIIPGEAFAIGDIRALSNAQAERTQAKMRAIVAQSLPQTSAEILFKDGYPAMAATAGSRAVLARLNAVNRDLGLGEMGELDPLRRGAGDIAFVSELPGLIGLGTAGDNGHALGEDMEVASLVRQAQRAAILMYRLSRERR